MFKKKFKKIDNLFKFEISDNVTKNVTAFYDFAPFPNYKNHQNKHSLNSIGENNFLFKQLKKFLGNNSNFIEIGSDCFITMGSNILRNIPSDSTATSNEIFHKDHLANKKLKKKYFKL